MCIFKGLYCTKKNEDMGRRLLQVTSQGDRLWTRSNGTEDEELTKHAAHLWPYRLPPSKNPGVGALLEVMH